MYSLHCVDSLCVQTNGKVANDNGHSELHTENLCTHVKVYA